MIRINLLLLAVIAVTILSAFCEASRSFHRYLAEAKKKTFAVAGSSAKTASSPQDILLAANFSGVASFHWPGKNETKFWKQNFGYLDMLFKVTFPSGEQEARYPVASNTKLYMAISIYQLVEAGKIKSIDDDIADYLSPADFNNMGLPGQTKLCPQLQNTSDSDPRCSPCCKITFADLLGMSSGLPNIGKQWLPFPGSLALVCGWHINQPLLFVPGSASPYDNSSMNYYYSNSGFECVSYFIEKFSGMHLNDYLTQNIFKKVPGGMPSTYFDPMNGKFGLDSLRVNEFYQYINKDAQSQILGLGVVSSEFDLGSAAGAGGIISDQRDERALYRALFSNFSLSGSNPLISQQNLLKLLTPRSFIQEGFFYGQGVFLFAPPGQTVNDQFPNGVTQIVYEGEIMGSHTSNVFDLRYQPAAMAQVWSSVIVFYPSVKEFSQVSTLVNRHLENQNFWQITNNWNQQTALQELSIELIQFFLGSPPQ